MIPLERDVLTIVRGDETIFNEEGIYDICTYPKDGGTAVSILDAITEEVLYEGLPLKYMLVKAPFINIQIEKV